MMLMLSDERKEMIYKLMAMVDDMQKIAVMVQEKNLQLETEIRRLKAK